MKFVFYTTTISPHQLPFARELVKTLGLGNYRYIYTKDLSTDRKSLGWQETKEEWILREADCRLECQKLLEECDILLVGGVLDFELFERRISAGKKTIYCSERWFKPCVGILRLFWPPYFKKAMRFARLLRWQRRFWYFPIGIHAAKDMARMCGVMDWDLMCLFRTPKLRFEKQPGGKVFLVVKDVKLANRYCLDKMRMWGYFVDNSEDLRKNLRETQLTTNSPQLSTMRVLWVGRVLALKRVDTVVRAVVEHANLRQLNGSLSTITLDVYGIGPEVSCLRNMAKGHEDIIKFYPPVSLANVRKLMCEHDVYVLSSNGYEGWGAVVSEALEEGMKVLGTYEAGSAATILDEHDLFHAGDWRSLQSLLEKCANQKSQGMLKGQGIGKWSVTKATDPFVTLLDESLGTA